MRKSYLTLAAVALVMASCSNEVLIDDIKPDQPDVAIGFETFNNKVTKAENSSNDNTESLYAHHTKFAVWGYKDVETSDYVFGTSATEGTTVEGSKVQSTITWKYSPLRFWDKNANRYDFYAAAPITDDVSKPQWTLNGGYASDKQQVNYFTLADVELENKTLIETTYSEVIKSDEQTNIDYMISSDCYALNDNSNSYPATVTLNFNHILSRLNITVKKGTSLTTLAEDYPDDAKLQIVAVEVHNMVSKGSFNEHKDIAESDGKFDDKDKAVLQAGTDKRWTLSANASDVVTYTGYVESDQAKSVPASTTEAPSFFILQSLVMPQTVGFEVMTRDGKDADGKAIGATGCSISEPYLYVEYKIGTDYKVKTVDAGASVEGLYTYDSTQEKYVACASNDTAVEGTTYYEYLGKPETFKAYYNLADAFGAKTYKKATVAEGKSVKGLYTYNSETKQYSACGDSDVANASIVYYRLVGDEIAFNEGWQNTLNITIDVNAIELDANVYKWADGESNDITIKK